MRTTIDLPDELLQSVKIRAAIERVKMRDLFERYVREGLARVSPPAGEPRRERSPLPIARKATGVTLPDLTNEEIEELLAADEAKLP